MDKNFNSVNYCLVTCTEHPVKVISSVVRKSVVSDRSACLVDFDTVVQTVNVPILCTYRSVSFTICHLLTPMLIYIFKLTITFSKVSCNTPILFMIIISLITTFFMKTLFHKNTVSISITIIIANTINIIYIIITMRFAHTITTNSIISIVNVMSRPPLSTISSLSLSSPGSSSSTSP